jgi:hypothetical protein
MTADAAPERAAAASHQTPWNQFAERSDKGGWPAARFLMVLAEREAAERDRRRIERRFGGAKRYLSINGAFGLEPKTSRS